METSLKTDFAQIFSRCPKNLSCPKFGGAAAPLAPLARTPMVIVPCNITYTGLLVTTIFSPTQRCIVGTMLQPFETMSQ